MVYEYLDQSKAYSKKRLDHFVGAVGDEADRWKDVVCVYATGSYGRREAGPESDLDLFIVSRSSTRNNGVETFRKLSKLDEIELQSLLIRKAREIELPQFDGDGRFLRAHSFDDFVKNLGGPYDDSSNTLTGRMLLLLESKPALGKVVYGDLIDHVLNKYFVDFEDYKDGFSPAFLMNDILRLWRTFCVNYEHNRKGGSDRDKVKNLKLKYSRMITCYSAVLYLLWVFRVNRTVNKQDVAEMVSMSPVDRLRHVGHAMEGEAGEKSAATAVDQALRRYSDFLIFAHQQKASGAVLRDAEWKNWREASHEFGRHLATAVTDVGHRDGVPSALFRVVLT